MMNDIERIRKRIYHKNKNASFLWMYRMMIVFMCAITFVLSGLIVTETSFEDAKHLLLQYIDKIELSNILIFENWFLPSNKAVNSTISYQQIDDQYFTNSTNMVYAIADGVCVYLNESEQGYQMIVKNDNDILVTYANMSDVSVKVDDRILKNSIIGTYQDKLYMDFMENQNFISYEQAIGKN
ncbi:MAG: M23 family metallopeptidase [Erysipelotrichaceae bacterium]|nr:M23 family metallopeptidase [Erysipelotrichaceae bacterium]